MKKVCMLFDNKASIKYCSTIIWLIVSVRSHWLYDTEYMVVMCKIKHTLYVEEIKSTSLHKVKNEIKMVL